MTFPDGIPLDTAFVSPSVIHQLDASAEDAVACGSWCDLQALLPPALTHQDTAAVLDHCSVMQSSGELQPSLCCVRMQVRRLLLGSIVLCPMCLASCPAELADGKTG